MATFLGGLSLGYYLCGKFSTQIRNHFRAYALAEGLIGVWCLCFPDIFGAVESLTRYWHFSPPLLIIIQGVFCSALLMGIPTVCMGATIPFLTQGLSRNVAEATQVHAGIYALNTVGAFLGTLAAGFCLIPSYGLPATIRGTAFVNLGACLFLWGISGQGARGEGRGARGQGRGARGEGRGRLPDIRDEEQGANYSPGMLYVIAFLSGFYVMTLENVLIRITNLSLGSSSYSFSLIVSVFILSIAVGSYVVGRLKEIPGHLLFTNQFLITLSLLFVYVSLDTWPYWAHLIRAGFLFDLRAFWGYYGNVFVVLTFVLIVPVGLMGATVPIAFHEIKRDLGQVGKHSGLLFSLNTMGNLFGSLVGGIFFYYFSNNKGVFLSAILLAALSTCLAGRNLETRKRYVLPAAAMLTTLVFIFLIFTPFYNEDHFMVGTFTQRGALPYSSEGAKNFFKKWNSKRELKFYKDGPTATVAVTEHPYPPGSPDPEKSLSIVVNGKSDSSTIGDAYMIKLLAHIPCLFAKNRENVMVIGLGTGVTAGELTLYPDTEKIDVAEISPYVIKALPYFQKFTHDVHLHPKVSIHIGDAFRIIGRSQKKWDIIISEPSNPWVTGVDLLFTREFYQLAKAHLSENGILVQWVHTYFADISMLGMIVNTVQQEFPHSRMFMASPGDLILVAPNQPLSLEDIKRAEDLLSRNEQVRSSLGDINLRSVESILIREVWAPAYISDTFSDFAIQTMDHPRLHYMAGKRFFFGTSVPTYHLFGPRSAPYSHDFLITKKFENWEEGSLSPRQFQDGEKSDTHFSKERFRSLVSSLRDKYMGYDLPMADALRLKAYAEGDSDLLSAKEKRVPDILPFLARLPENKADWDRIGLKGASFREKATVLLNHVNRFRNWIVPYPVDGLRQLLEKGALNGKDEDERNWCVLQMVSLEKLTVRRSK